MRIFLAPNWSSAQEFISNHALPEATVEAEYGKNVLKGKKITLAHHHEDYKNNPAPCNTVVEKLPEGSTIVISHIDLDTIGGIMGLIGRKPDDKEFWEVVEYIDLYGPHHLEKFPKQKDKLNAYWYWASMESIYPKVDKTIDVTELVHFHIKALERILTNQEPALIEGGKKWKKEVEQKVENCLIEENNFMRIFKTKNVFCSSAYYSKKLNKTIPVTITFHERKKDITLATCDTLFKADEIMQKLFGSEAGGKSTIAKTPRGKKMTIKDFENTIQEILSIYEKKYGVEKTKLKSLLLKTA